MSPAASYARDITPFPFSSLYGASKFVLFITVLRQKPERRELKKKTAFPTLQELNGLVLPEDLCRIPRVFPFAHVDVSLVPLGEEADCKALVSTRGEQLKKIFNSSLEKLSRRAYT